MAAQYDIAVALRGLRVVNLGTGCAPALVARLMAGAGAEVSRLRGPWDEFLVARYPAAEYWLESQPGFDLGEIDSIVAQADLCIVGGETVPDTPELPGAQALATAHPRLVILEIGAYGEAALAGRPGCEILAQARSGLAYEQFSDRPMFMAFEPANIGAALHGLTAALAAIYEREGSGLGQVARVTLGDGLLTYAAYFWADLEHPSPRATLVIPKDPKPLVLECADGEFVHIVLSVPGAKAGLYRVLGIGEEVDPRASGIPTAETPADAYFGDVPLLARHTRRFRRDALLAALWEEKSVVAEAVLEPGQCWDEPQIQTLALIEEVGHGRRVLGIPISMHRSQARWKSGPVAAAGSAPLTGVRIADFGAFVAGPYAAALLADLGADVIKIEPPTGDPVRFAYLAHASVNRAKRSLAVDLKSDEGRDIARRLCLNADVVMNNFRTGVSARLGLDAATLLPLRPDLIVLESSAFGPHGPKAQSPGFDLAMQAYTGLERRQGGRGNPPLWNRTCMVDYTAGLLGAAAILIALVQRRRTGHGAELQVPLVNGGIFLAADLVRETTGLFRAQAELDPDLRGRHPAESFYETSDGWIAIAARGAAMAARLAQALSLGAMPSAPSEWRDREQRLIAEAARRFTSGEILDLLNRAAVWAEPCLRADPPDLLSNAEARSRGIVWEALHPEHGRVRHLGRLVSFSRSRLPPTSPPPVVGQHSAEILAELGLGATAS